MLFEFVGVVPEDLHLGFVDFVVVCVFWGCGVFFDELVEVVAVSSSFAHHFLFFFVFVVFFLADFVSSTVSVSGFAFFSDLGLVNFYWCYGLFK